MAKVAYTWDVYSDDAVALKDENGFDVATLVRVPRQDGSRGFRTDTEEWQGIVDALPEALAFELQDEDEV